jgi:hypothetical protein
MRNLKFQFEAELAFQNFGEKTCQRRDNHYSLKHVEIGAIVFQSYSPKQNSTSTHHGLGCFQQRKDTSNQQAWRQEDLRSIQIRRGLWRNP